jgi:predicted transcriptional regulator
MNDIAKDILRSIEENKKDYTDVLGLNYSGLKNYVISQLPKQVENVFKSDEKINTFVNELIGVSELSGIKMVIVYNQVDK